MSITQIEAEQLRNMNDKEGLILQGCGGNAQKWLDGINEMLTEAGILQNGSIVPLLSRKSRTRRLRNRPKLPNSTSRRKGR